MARTPGKKSSPDNRPRRTGGAPPRRSPTQEKIAVLVQKAEQAWSRRAHDDAVRFYERAVDLDPANVVLLVDLGRAYALTYRYAEAERLVDRAGKLHPDDADLQRMLGRSFQQLQQFDRAIACFQRALELAPDAAERAETLYELTRMYERLHRLEEARACALESLSLAPHQPVLRYLLGLIDRREGNPDAALAKFQEVIDARNATPEIVADAWYQSSAIHDQRRDYPAAFDAAAEAKRILSEHATLYRYDAADTARTARRTYAASTADHFVRWHAAGATFKPLGRGLALLTSHPRSGTTLLEQVLDAHPQLVSADELQVMADVVYLPLCRDYPGETPVPAIMDEKTPAEVALKRAAYWQSMEGALRQPIGERTLLDKNPALTNLLPIVARVFPEMKIVFALRDPRDVVVSCFMQQLPLNPVSVNYLTIEATAEAYAATMHGWLKYRELMKNPWIQVRYEDVVVDMEREARLVLDFLGLPWDDGVLRYRERLQEKHVHSPTYEAVTKPVYKTSIARWRNYERQLAPCLSSLRPYIEAFGYADA